MEFHHETCLPVEDSATWLQWPPASCLLSISLSSISTSQNVFPFIAHQGACHPAPPPWLCPWTRPSLCHSEGRRLSHPPLTLSTRRQAHVGLSVSESLPSQPALLQLFSFIWFSLMPRAEKVSLAFSSITFYWSSRQCSCEVLPAHLPWLLPDSELPGRQTWLSCLQEVRNGLVDRTTNILEDLKFPLIPTQQPCWFWCGVSHKPFIRVQLVTAEEQQRHAASSLRRCQSVSLFLLMPVPLMPVSYFGFDEAWLESRLWSDFSGGRDLRGTSSPTG